MYNQYNESDIQDTVAKEEFKLFFKAIKNLNLNLSERYNAIYGIEDIVSVLMNMVKNRSTAHKACINMSTRFKDNDNVRIPTSQWLLAKLREVDPDLLETASREMLNGTIGNLKGIGKKKRLIVAIDAHQIPFTGANRHADKWVIGGKPKGGTSWFETYATLQAVSEPQMPTLAVERIKKNAEKTEYVRKLLLELTKQGVKRRLLLMDREFSNVGVMNFLDKRKEKFLMAVSKTPKIKEAISEFRRGKRRAISRQTMTSSNGATCSFWLVIKKRSEIKKGKKTWRYLTFATNVERHVIKNTMKDIPAEYKKRWRIENNYKSVNGIRSHTGSRNHAVRTFLFFLSLAACNQWYAAMQKLKVIISVKLNQPARHISIDVFMTMIVMLAEQVIKSPDKKLAYYLICVK